MVRSVAMQHAIHTLQTSLEIVEINEPVHRAEGLVKTADHRLEQAKDFREAIAALQCIQAGYPRQPETFVGKIAAAINHHSLEAGSDTPDFILAEYLKRCLENFDLTMQHRATWFEPSDGAEDVLPTIETPSQEYRMLEVGDVIQEGDEMFSFNKGPWEPTMTNNHGKQFHLGYVKHRRPL